LQAYKATTNPTLERDKGKQTFYLPRQQRSMRQPAHTVSVLPDPLYTKRQYVTVCKWRVLASVFKKIIRTHALKEGTYNCCVLLE
jgi:hypothetical protein